MSEKEVDASGEAEPTIAQDIVVTKYTSASEIVSGVLTELLAKCVEGQSVKELCEFGDHELEDRTSKIFKKKDVKKGIAFPTCISVNNCVCHFSPLRSEPDVILATGDVVKIDCGAHIDGFVATVAHTLVVGASPTCKVTGRKADVILAAYYCTEAAVRMLKPGHYKNMDITDTISKVAAFFHCTPVENMLSHQLKRNKIDGPKQIIQNPGEKQRQETKSCEFENCEVYAIDILISTGDGKPRVSDKRCTVYKRVDDIVYQLKLKASRTFFSEVDKRFGYMPFSLRSFEDEKNARMGVIECEKHNLLKPFQVLYEREGEYVAQFKTTVLILPSGLLKITGLPFLSDVYQSQYSVQDREVWQRIQAPLRLKKGKKKNEEPKQETNPAAPTVTVTDNPPSRPVAAK